MAWPRYDRQIDRYQPPDWHSRNAKLCNSSRSLRDESLDVRRDSQLLKLETDVRTKWYTFENNQKLSGRVDDIERWHNQLEKTLDELNGEIRVLREAKENCERALEAKNHPHNINIECLSIREGRREYEVVRDAVERALNDEHLLIEKIRSQLKNKCEEAWDELAHLELIRGKVQLDLQDKSHALKIDLEQLHLNSYSSNISHKPDCVSIPKGSVQTETWHDYSSQHRDLAEAEMFRSQNLREEIFHVIEKTSNDIRVQIDETNFEFRKRAYEMNRAKEELEHQMRTTEEEMSEQEGSIYALEKAIKDKENPLKVAETRLENRKSRPRVELCADVPMEGLIMEVMAIRESISLLEDKLDKARETLSELQNHHRRLQDDHTRKSMALGLDNKCIGVRQSLTLHDASIKAMSDKNLKLTGTLRKNTSYLENSVASKYY